MPEVRKARHDRGRRQKVMREQPQRLIFLDETGTDTGITREYGRSLRGERLKGRASRIGTVSIGQQNDILVDNRRDHLWQGIGQGIGVDRRENRTDCRVAAISGNPDWNLFI